MVVEGTVQREDRDGDTEVERVVLTGRTRVG